MSPSNYLRLSLLNHLTIFFKGFVTDGEFNSLRTQGKDRPISVIQLIMDARNEARAIPAKEIEKFFKPVKTGMASRIVAAYK